MRNNTKQKYVFRVIAIMIISVFLVNIVPCTICAQTLGNDAEKKYKSAPSPDEFDEKATERRDDNNKIQQKDPRLACLLSLIIPGGGHIYLRNDLKAAGFCILASSAYSLSGYYLFVALKRTDSSTEKKSRLILSGMVFLVGALIHMIGIVESYNDAIEINEKEFYFGGIEKSSNPYVAKNQ